jgi:hypothetical protein
VPAVPGSDVRAARAAQGMLAVLLLAGFVFRNEWLLFASTLLALADAGTGPEHGPVSRVYRRIAARYEGKARGGAPVPPIAVSARGLRVHAAVVAGACTAATLLELAGVGGLAWFVALLTAAVAALAGGARWFLGAELLTRDGDDGHSRRRPRPRRRPGRGSDEP